MKLALAGPEAEVRSRIRYKLTQYMGKSEEFERRGNMVINNTVVAVNIVLGAYRLDDALCSEIVETILFECGNVENYPALQAAIANKLTTAPVAYGEAMCVPEAMQMFQWGKGLFDCKQKKQALSKYGEEQLAVVKKFLPNDVTGFIKEFVTTKHGVGKTMVKGGVNKANTIDITMTRSNESSSKQSARSESPDLDSIYLYAYELISGCTKKDDYKTLMENISNSPKFRVLWQSIFNNPPFTSSYERIWMYCMIVAMITKAQWPKKAGTVFPPEVLRKIEVFISPNLSPIDLDGHIKMLQEAVRAHPDLQGETENQVLQLINKKSISG